jgi:hypothetical protein
MAAGDKVQIGKQFKVEYGAFTYSGYQPTSITNSKTAAVESVIDIRGAVCTHIITNPAKQLTLTCYIESSGSIVPPGVGDEITVTPPEGTSTKYLLIAPATVTHGNSITTLSMTLTREDSMAATYDA